MRLNDLIELLLEPVDSVRCVDGEADLRDRSDTSSLADIVRILRELDGQHDPESR
jgi:hypothetical protein